MRSVMRRKLQMVMRVICAAVLAANCLPAFAQSAGTLKRTAAPAQDRVMIAPAQEADITTWKMTGDTFHFVAAEGAFGSKSIKGAPYSAQAVTEEIQVLSDGNRIVRRNTSSVY